MKRTTLLFAADAICMAGAGAFFFNTTDTLYQLVSAIVCLGFLFDIILGSHLVSKYNMR